MLPKEKAKDGAKRGNILQCRFTDYLSVGCERCELDRRRQFIKCANYRRDIHLRSLMMVVSGWAGELSLN